MPQDLAEVDLPEQGFRVQLLTWRALLDRPLTSYYLVLGITLLLLGLGLVMVQSTASVADLTAGLSPYSDFKKQLLGACIGLPLMWVAARSSPKLFRALAYPLLAVSVVGLCPTLILLVLFLALLWVIGTPGRVYTSVLILMALAMVLMIVSAKYRFQRLTGYLAQQGSATGPNMQAIQGKYAVGSGGWFGVGLGASGGKWGWVPESTTDFIFAIIGEELGLIGTMCVTVLYGGLAFAGLRIARRVPDMFCRLGATAITAWIVVQAAINIGAVIGALPITGVPLPLVSAGLSSLLVTLVGLGMLMSFARLEPGAREALAARGPGWPLRVLSWLGLSKHRK